ncbi:MAG: methionyl-tRNA formyltransferase [Lachnospiraceae bacterium]|nr:methionyl-tRNA formyltransferase [Lachnospiraceae bacterium]MDE7358982.1 methionyl-tRNA formyltransferase [Lachnospiraceae bacterium]
MNITVFTSNQPRHISLINSLATIAHRVFAIQECNTVFPGEIKDFFDNSDVMNTYFQRVRAAENEVFGSVGFLSGNVDHLALKSGDLNKIPQEVLSPALKSDVYVVFGSSYIKGWLIDYLVEQRAINIHMGVSPYYRGSSCNFWAAYDGHPDLVGATIHLLGKGLDSGNMLYHALPRAEIVDPFVLGMKAVKVAHESLIERIANKEIFKYEPIIQDKSKEYRYTRNADFTDDVAREYLEALLSPEQLKNKLEQRDLSLLEKPFIA